MTPRAKNIALALLAMTQFVVVIDASIVNIALPSIGKALKFSQADLSWVVNAYTLTFGGFLLLGGRLADLMGRRRMFMVGLVLFSFASLAGGFAQSEAWLIAARALQGMGAAIVSPAALSIITTTFADGEERNRALGVWGAVAGAGGAAGVLLGGVLTSGLSWRWVLFVNVPIGVICAALAPKLLLESRAEVQTRSFDIPGAVTVTAGLALLVYALVDAVNVGWGSTATIAKIAGALVLLSVFLLIERRQRSPLMPLSIFRLRTLRGADTVALLDRHVAVLDVLLHLALHAAGARLLGVARGALLPAVGGRDHPLRRGRIVRRHPLWLQAGARRGPAVVAGGLFWFSKVRARRHVRRRRTRAFATRGNRPRASRSCPSRSLRHGHRPHEAGLASGLVNTAQQVGGALGLAILATVANSRTKDILRAGGHDAAYALTKGFERAFLVGAGFALALARCSRSC